MNLIELKDKLEKRLMLNLPGQETQRQMLIESDKLYPFDNKVEDAIPSAVLILLFEQDDGIHFALTERTHTVDHHRGQISLPGGVQEDGEDLSFTAKRETHEEIGLNPEEIDIIGKLSSLFVIVTGFNIQPYIGIYNSTFEPILAPNEVASVFSVPIQDLINDNNMKIEERIIRGYDVNVPYFHFNKHKVWGATAMILSEFKTVLKEVYDA
jgi:8-oxo-dGTP pyrophosphatase MutT (NUDIX family)|tara:strand:+ start:85 stop:717 length:633 start_codon:yes stop_codon:yes gene_type:complete